jgi:hypothetical protein
VDDACNDSKTGIIMFTTEGNIEYICQPDVEIFGDVVIFGFLAFCNNEFLWSLCYIIYRFAFTALS